MRRRAILGATLAAALSALAVAAPAPAAESGGTEVALDSTPNLIQVQTVEADPAPVVMPATEEAPTAATPAAEATPPAPPAEAPKPSPVPIAAATAPASAAPGALRQLTETGGWVMYGIYACAGVVLLVAAERALALRSRKVLPADFLRNVGALAAARPPDREKILTYCVASSNPAARIFQATVRRLSRQPAQIELAIQDAGRKERQDLGHVGRAITGAAWIAPLLGLLGASIDLIGYLMDAAAGDAANGTALLAQSLSRSLVPVAAGLAVAVVGAAIHFALAARIDRLVAEMEDLALELVETLEGRGWTKPRPDTRTPLVPLARWGS